MKILKRKNFLPFKLNILKENEYEIEIIEKKEVNLNSFFLSKIVFAFIDHCEKNKN